MTLLIRSVRECAPPGLQSGWLTTGVRQFEEDFARYLWVRNAVAVNSCTGALHLALEAVNSGSKYPNEAQGRKACLAKHNLAQRRKARKIETRIISRTGAKSRSTPV
jgi:hypothetical protein